MTKTEIFDSLRQFDGINRAKLTLQNSISTYDHNFYTVPKDICDAPFDFLFMEKVMMKTPPNGSCVIKIKISFVALENHIVSIHMK